MEQMNVPEEMKVTINFDDKSLSEAVRTLRPLVYLEGDSFYCLLGPDTQKGVIGRGPNREAALTDWESNMRKRIIYHSPGDEVARFIEDNLNASVKDVW